MFNCMKIKHFPIRLTKEHLQTDEDKLNEFMQSVAVKKTATEVITNAQIHYWSILVFYEDWEEQNIQYEQEKYENVAFEELDENELAVYETLRVWRNELALEQNIPNYFISSNATIMSIAKFKPQTIEELYKIKGMGEIKIAKYGSEILALLKSLHNT